MSNVVTTKYHYYRAWGLIIQSQVECPLTRIDDTKPDVIISKGKVPKNIENPLYTTPLSKIKPGETLLDLPEIAKFYITHGNSILVEPYPDADHEDIVVYLLGSAMSAIFHQRGLLPIHGSAVSLNDQVIIIAGKSGVGKSTMAAEFVKRGLQFVSDDITVISLNDYNLPIAFPSFPKAKLWSHSFRLLELELDHANSVRKKINKFYYDLDDQIVKESQKVAAIFNLTLNLNDTLEISSLNMLDAVTQIGHNTFRYRTLLAHGNQKHHFNLCTSLANHCLVFEVSRSHYTNTISKLADQILEYVQ